MVTCSKCGADPERVKTFDRTASMSGSIMGDEHIESLYYCQACGVYTIEYYVDHFGGDETARTEGPIAKERGDELVKIISRCDRPWDKKCRCPAHVEYFDGGLD